MVESKDSTQTLEQLAVLNSKSKMPAPNHNYLRLYGHTLCPFVEKVRLVLAAKGIPY